MKRRFLILLTICCTFLGINTVNAKELPKVDHDPINVYIFRGDSCGYCHSALEFLEKSDEKYGDYYNVIGFEVSTGDNSSLWEKVGEHFGDEIGPIPYIVIGDAYHATGFDEETIGKKLIEVILEQYQNDKYVDVVGKYIDEAEEKKQIEFSQNKEFSVVTDAVTSSSDSEDKSSDVFIIVGIFVVLIGGIAGLVVASRK